MWRIGAFLSELWDDMRDEWESGSRLAHAEAISVGVMVLYSAIYIPLVLRFGVVVHPPYPHPGWAFDQMLANHVHAMEAAPLQTLMGWFWLLLILVASGTFLTYCAVSIGSGIHRIRRRREYQQDPPAEFGGEQLKVGLDTELWGKPLQDAGVNDL